MFYRVKNYEAAPRGFASSRGFRPDKTRALSFLNGFKTILEKRLPTESS